MQSGGAQLEAQRARVLNYAFNASNGLVSSNWRGNYRTINRANFVIARVPEMVVPVQIEESKKNRYEAEARFLRAWSYFELVSLWGPVPVVTEPITTENGVPGLPRADSEETIYSLIFDDLTKAIPNLPLRNDLATNELGRAPREAAQALAAKIYMFRGEYSKAKPFLDEIIAGKAFKLVDRFLDNFQEENENNAESLFEVQFSEAFGDNGAWSAQGNGAAEVTFRGQEYGPNAWRNLIPSDGLVSEFEVDDPRKNYTFYQLGDLYNDGKDTLKASNVQGDSQKPSWKKYQTIYKRKTENVRSGINFRVIRYADVLLMAAECENDAGNIPEAIAYMNEVRDRADVMMPHYPTAEYPCNDKTETLRAIMHERRVELAGEQIRNRDIRRWRRQGKLTTEPISNYVPKYDLLPIPTEEIDNNSALTNANQNSGF